MSLLENVVAALLFSAVAGVSLGIWSLGLSAEAQRAERERSGDRIDADLTALEVRLRAGAAALPPAGDCASASQQLGALADQQPPASGLWRQLRVTAPDPGLEVTVGLSDGGPGSAGQSSGAAPRQRWFSPAALGLCGGWGGADATR
jgi:hypothetical protein